jgi:hypothetical protein
LKIKYLNGNRLYYAFLAGGNAVIQDKDYLDKINVFPVPDSDTGTNLASTMRSIAEEAKPYPSLKETLRSMADAALLGARGNSGIIFAQFLYGFSSELQNERSLSTGAFAETIKKAVNYAYKSIVSPVEGTMLTVIKDWAESIYERRKRTSDFAELLEVSLQVAKQSLKETTQKLAVLARAGVVDAGAKGFVDFLEGIVFFIRKGALRKMIHFESKAAQEPLPYIPHTRRESLQNRYCAEALIVGEAIAIDQLKQEIIPYGDSIIVAGSGKKARIHIHTNLPADVFYKMKDYGDYVHLKIDDMKRQYEVTHHRKEDIALVTDSACDLPQQIIDEYQIHIIPFHVTFGNSLFLDKISITPKQFYTLLRTSKEVPKSSQPSVKTIERLLSFLARHYPSIIMVSISDGLSGTYKTAQEIAKKIDNKKAHIVNSKHLSASQGLIVLRIAEAIRGGKSYEEILGSIDDWIAKTKILVDLQTLKYMVRGGRVKPLKGLLAKLLNIKPILSLDSEGKAAGLGKSFSRRSNMKKILKSLRQMAEKKAIWKYAIVHAQNESRARTYAEKITEMTGMNPAFVVDVSPVLGVHTGIGTLAVALMFQ